MQQIIDFVGQNYWWISILALFAISVLNAVTKHFGEGNPKIVPVIAVIIEALSFLTSKGAENGNFGKFKLPMQNVIPKNKIKVDIDGHVVTYTVADGEGFVVGDIVCLDANGNASKKSTGSCDVIGVCSEVIK